MSKYPSITGKKSVMALKRKGYVVLRQKGSHVSIGSPEDNTVFAVVMNTSDDLCKDTLQNIKHSLKLSREDFIKILQDC
jgi:predicted RNA binding protein YcfA (HicA-like mRNA interferase family)